MQRKALISLLLTLTLLVIASVPFVMADCDGTPTAGDDNITCTGTTTGNVKLDDGNDTVVNEGTINKALSGQAGNDTMTNLGTIGREMQGGNGNDVLINTGIVERRVRGQDGDDAITVSGTVLNEQGQTNALGAGKNNDTVTIYGTAELNGLIDGGKHIDSLDFQLGAMTNAEEFGWLVGDLEGAAAAGGQIYWDGKYFHWINFESLSWYVYFDGGAADIYFVDIPADELPAYGDGTAPVCTFAIGRWGAKWIAREQCGEFTDASALEVVCLDSTGNWTSEYVKSTAATADGKLTFVTEQVGICAAFAK